MPTYETFTLTTRTYLTADGKAVAAGEPGGVKLLGVKGTVISLADAKRFGLVKPAPKKRSKGTK